MQEIKPTDSTMVDAFMTALKHPKKDVLEKLRQVILQTDKEIGEEIKWNAPTFFYAGKMAPSDPKLYKRYLIVSNFFKKDMIRLVFPSGAKVNDKSGLLQGDFADGRRLAHFTNLQDVKVREKDLQKIIKTWLKLLDKK